jgi:hypothetical protein
MKRHTNVCCAHKISVRFGEVQLTARLKIKDTEINFFT